MSNIPRRPVPTAQREEARSRAGPQSQSQYHRVGFEDEAEHAAPHALNEREGLPSPVSPTLDASQASPEDFTRHETATSVPKLEGKPAAQSARYHDLGHKWDRITSDHWTYELIGVLTSVATLVSIIGVLLAYEGGPTPHIMRGVSLNTAISILATISRAAVVYVAASVIAEQKWLRFEQNFSSMHDVSLYDDATRGPLGSLFLLRSFHIGFVTLIAAGVAVLALGFEPFVQQSVRYPLKGMPVSTGLPEILTVKNVTLENRAGQNRTLILANVVSQGLYSDSVTPLQPSCGGTSCDWPLYESVAFCSSCEDALEDIDIQPKHDPALQAYTKNDYLSTFQFSDLNLNYNGFDQNFRRSVNTDYTISLGVGAPVKFTLNTSANIELGDQKLTTSMSYAETIVWDLNDIPSNPCTFMDIDYSDCMIWTNATINGITGPLKALGYVKLAPNADGSLLVATSAQRCTLSPCALQYSSTVQNGSLTTLVTKTENGYYQAQGTPLASPEEADDGPTPATLTWFASSHGSEFQAGPTYGASHSILFNFLFVLTSLQGTVTRWHTTGDPYFYEGQPGSGTFNPAPDVIQFMSNVRNSTAKISQALTNFIQQNGDVEVKGQVYQATPYVEVRWAWLIFPISLFVLVLAALVATMLQTRKHRMPIWKSSPYPLLFNYHNDERYTISDATAANDITPQAVTTSRHDEMAKETLIRLRSSAGKWTFEKKT